MNKILIILSLVLLTACGPSQEEKEKVAAVTCSIMGETRNMDAAIRVEKMNDAREKIGGEPFLRGDDAIQEAFGWGLCQELVLNESYDETLQPLKDAKRERERIAREKLAEEQRIAAEKQRIAAEKRAEEQRIAAEKRAEEQRIAAEKQRIADSKPTVKEEFYSDGKLKTRRNYQSKSDGGVRHGLSEAFYENGQLHIKGNFKDGKIDGLYEKYYEDGELLVVLCYKNGDRTDMSYCEKEARIAAEKRAEEQRIAAKKRAEEQRITDSKPTVKEDELAANSYRQLIQRRLAENWNRPPSARREMETIIRLQLVPTGRVVGVTILKSSGDTAFDRSVEQAAFKADQFFGLQKMSPSLFEKKFRQVDILFNPQDLRL